MGSNMANDFEIDRDLQRRNVGNNGYTGVAGNMQDPMITESMGPIQDRTKERLASSDAMIIRTRRRLLTVARALARDGSVPPGVDDPDMYLVRSTQAILPKGADWIEATAKQRKAGHSALGLSATSA
jgi:phthalate 4,5-dioxygenase oxygenase subunit